MTMSPSASPVVGHCKIRPVLKTVSLKSILGLCSVVFLNGPVAGSERFMCTGFTSDLFVVDFMDFNDGTLCYSGCLPNRFIL